LPPAAPPERVALLPEILRAWAEEDLREHLARKDRSADRERREKLAAVATKASHLLDAMLDLDEEGRFTIACEAQTQRKASNSIPHLDLW
jgi:hypothetical protein